LAIVVVFKWDGWVARYRAWRFERRIRRLAQDWATLKVAVQDRLFADMDRSGLDTTELRRAFRDIEESFS
jgi:hypothetical protein